tara:strand:- start:126276 stop:128393 length:2118 start_codon:yes stop_codon:yes gene_type:complete
MKICSFLPILSVFILISCNDESTKPDTVKWSQYLGGSDRNHFSKIDQITPENVKDLQIAWTYKAPDSGQMQMNPLMVNGKVYGVTSAVQIFALDAETGKEIWRYGDPLRAWHSTSRGVSYWESEDGKDKRILGTIGASLYALNADNGQLIPDFGNNGAVDLHTGLPESAKDKFIISNTPGTIFKNLIIMPVRLSEGADAAPGDIRAFNVITGKLEWTFHTIPHPGEAGYETWENTEAYKNEGVGAVNNWAGMAVDKDREIIFVPTGSAAPDFYGAKRKGSGLYANSLLALDANTGKLIWHYQFVHHDIWDRDLPAPPNLIEVERDGKKIAAVAQITKQGYVFVFNRETGEPLFDIEEVEVPASNLPGEEAWPTQPLPVKPLPFARQAKDLTEYDISPFAENKDELLKILNAHDKRMFAPPGLDPVLLLPGYDGGAEWGGAGADPENGILYINSNEMAWTLQLEETKAEDIMGESPGESLYNINCASCHQKDRKGLPASNYPSLQNIHQRLTKEAALSTISNGKGMMPGFTFLKDDEKDALVSFLFGEEKKEVASTLIDTANIPPYSHTGYHKFLDSNGLPGITPPWGTLNALDLNTGEYLWKIPLGSVKSLFDKGIPETGTENYGGPIITENGLLMIAATKDGFFRIFDRNTGKLLWKTKLPAASFATPSTYMINGKQYIVLACGGEKLGTEKGNEIVAYALPEN